MATTSNPYGLRPLNRVGALLMQALLPSFLLQVRMPPISSTGTSLLLSLVERLKK